MWSSCSYSKSNEHVIAQLDGIGAFEKINEAVEASICAHHDIPGSDVASMYAGLLSFSQAVYPDRIQYIDDIMGKASKVLQSKSPFEDAKAEKKIVDLIQIPFESYDLDVVLQLENVVSVINVLSARKQRDLASNLSAQSVRKRVKLTKKKYADAFLNVLKPLVVNENDSMDDEVGGMPFAMCLQQNMESCFHPKDTSSCFAGDKRECK